MRCLVTGATGFVGRGLVARLHASGMFVRGLARTRAASIADELVTMDLTDVALDPALLDGIDVVFHLAARTHDMKEMAGVDAEYRRINVEATARLLSAARARKVRRFVFVSSVKAIDEGNVQPADEATPPRPLTAYGRSKLEAERLVAEAGEAGGIESVSVRFPLVYGPDQRGNLQRMIAAIDRGRFPPPPANGNRRSMLHVENAVEALWLAGTHPAARHVYIAADARPYSTREVYDAARAALGRPPVRWHVPEWGFRGLAGAGDLARRVAGRRLGFDADAFQKLLGSAVYDSGRIERELGYGPVRDLVGSMQMLVDNQRAGR